MNCSKLLEILGLIFNTLAALILILPNLIFTRNVEDNRIQNMNEKGDYIQKSDIRDQKINLIGLIFLSIGFILQLIGVIFF